MKVNAVVFIYLFRNGSERLGVEKKIREIWFPNWPGNSTYVLSGIPFYLFFT